MRKKWLLIPIVLLALHFFRSVIVYASAPEYSQHNFANAPGLKPSVPGLPLIFERNIGQAPPEVKFLSHGNDSLLLLASDKAILRAANFDSAITRKGSRASASPATMEMRLVGANPNAAVEGERSTRGTDQLFHRP